MFSCEVVPASMPRKLRVAIRCAVVYYAQDVQAFSAGWHCTNVPVYPKPKMIILRWWSKEFSFSSGWFFPLCSCVRMLSLSSIFFPHMNHIVQAWPLRCWWLIWPIQNDAKILISDWNPSTWVLIWKYSESFPMNTNMTECRWFSKSIASLCFGPK